MVVQLFGNGIRVGLNLYQHNLAFTTKREFQNPKNITQESVRMLEGVPKGGDEMGDQLWCKKGF